MQVSIILVKQQASHLLKEKQKEKWEKWTVLSHTYGTAFLESLT